MSFIEKANLPQKAVKTVLLGEIYKDIALALKGLGIETIPVAAHKSLKEELSFHADLQAFHFGGETFVVADEKADFASKLRDRGFKTLQSKAKLLPEYPYDIPLCATMMGEIIIANSLYLDPVIRGLIRERGISDIHVKQGYARCSVAVVNEKALITADEMIAKSAKMKGIDVLLISPGGIILKGYDYGFIGGASVLIDKDKICFTGDVKQLPDGEEILSFLEKHGVSPVFLSSGSPVDVGGIIPILT